MRSTTHLIALTLSVLASTVHAETRLSGTYVTHGPTFAIMLQLTQTENGQITGVMSQAALQSDGKITAEQGPIHGVIDSGQITLTFNFRFLSPGNFAGTASGDSIQLEQLGSNGNVSSWTFARGAPTDFQAYADQLKPKSQTIILTARLEKSAREMDAAIRGAQKWMSDAETHLHRIPEAENSYRKISAKMESLLQQERTTRNGVSRGQIVVAISQGGVAGSQADVQVNGLWDRLEGQGAALNRTFASYPRNCGSSEELAARGVSSAAIANWQSACATALAERTKFATVLTRVTVERADLKTFQQGEAQHREELERQSSQAE